MRHLWFGVVVLLFAQPARAQLATPNDAGVAWGHVHLAVTDIGLHEKLWTVLFEGRLVEREGYTAFQVPGTLVFFTEGEPPSPSAGTAMDHFGFKVRDIEAVLAEWRALGYEVESELTGAAGFRRAFVTMPDGARFELEEYPELSANAEMDHVHFFTPQYRELQAWYADLFGATPRVDRDLGTSADVPGSTLRFATSDEERAPTDGTAIDHIGFEVADMDSFVETLRDKGVELAFGPRYIESIDLWVAFFRDPSGVLVEVTEGLDNY